MSELTLTMLRLGFLAVLWMFVLTAVSVMRSDLFGARVSSRPAPRARSAPARRISGRREAKNDRVGPRHLVVTAGALTGTSVTLTDAPVTIGRAADSTVVLDDEYASTRHARLSLIDGAWILDDLGSTNGTYLNRARVTGPTPIRPGMPIKIGNTVLELRR
jgi:hypothetical protein